jgi:hypothetical protein
VTVRNPPPPRTFVCPICRGSSFDQRRGVMDTRGLAFLGWTWANRGCTEFICRGCRYVMTFADPH